jgi:SAM-dependent methyltransferase
MIQTAFITVTDYDFFPGTLATVNSILHFHPDVDVHVVVNHKHPLSEPQRKCFEGKPGVFVLDSHVLEQPGRFINAWELKAYASEHLADRYDVIVGIDSDCLLCSGVHGEIRRCVEIGGFLGGRDGSGADYDSGYSVYGIQTPAHNPSYMSTSLFFCACTPQNRRIFARWSECCNAAQFNGRGAYPGHGDQGVLNAILFSENALARIQLLPNPLWSQHWVYWDSIISFRNGEFVNLSCDGQPQRSFHCGGAEKFWSRDHRDRILQDRALQTYPYVWFLSMLWFGRCTPWDIDPCQILPPKCHPLIEDLVHFLPQIFQVHRPARHRWNDLSDAWIERILNGIPRFLSLRGGSMNDLIDLVADDPGISRFVEVGSYEGGSILALALRFAHRDVDFYSVESFMGNADGRMDGHELPSRNRYFDNLSRYRTLRVHSIPGDSELASGLFADGSLDAVFIDACHETDAVVRDLNAWGRKLRPGGILAGDDYQWDSVKAALGQIDLDVQVTPSGCVWWTRWAASTDAQSPERKRLLEQAANL